MTIFRKKINLDAILTRRFLEEPNALIHGGNAAAQCVRSGDIRSTRAHLNVKLSNAVATIV